MVSCSRKCSFILVQNSEVTDICVAPHISCAKFVIVRYNKRFQMSLLLMRTRDLSASSFPVVQAKVLNTNIAREEEPADCKMRREHPLGSVISVLRRSRHANEEYHKEREAESKANPPRGSDVDSLKGFATSPAKAPSLP